MIFSVVIPIYNSSSYIVATLDSIRTASRGMVYEVILIDDCSTDIHDVKTLLESYSEVKLVEKYKKTNAADSRNIGFELTSSDFVFFLDSDDHFVGNIIDRRIAIHKNESAGVVFGNYITCNDSVMMASSLPIYAGEGFRDYLFLSDGDCRTSTISVYKKLHKGTLFDSNSNKHQDWIFSILCSDNNENVVFDEVPSVLINVERAGRMSSSMNIKASTYFCDEYLSDKKHLNVFSKKHWMSMICNKDINACNFFFSIYSPFCFFDHVVFCFYKTISHDACIGFASFFISLLRRMKWFMCRKF